MVLIENHEDIILDQLNAIKDLQPLMSRGVELLIDNVNKLIIGILSKQKHATKYVVPSLIGNDGPLKNTDLQLKLLYALGFITYHDYEDISLLIGIDKQLKLRKSKSDYIEENILNSLFLLHNINFPSNYIETINEMIKLHNKNNYIIERFNNQIRSFLIVAITGLITRLRKDIN